SGGMVGGWVADGFRATIGGAAHAAPVALIVGGALLVGRRALVYVSPFRTGLAVTSFGLLAALGANHGGAIGRGLAHMFGILVRSAGAAHIRVRAALLRSRLT